jgi:hypothetical protein
VKNHTYGMPVLPPMILSIVDIGESKKDLEKWSRVVWQCHNPSIAVAERRLVSAIGRRLDSADRLIDAVTVWENLVGVSLETTFRVTAANKATCWRGSAFSCDVQLGGLLLLQPRRF